MLLDRLRPEAAFFSCGRDNIFGFPSEAVLRRCGDRRIPVFRTDAQGAIEAVSNGAEWNIRSHVRGPEEVAPSHRLSASSERGGVSAEQLKVAEQP
jgi:competence protein ComEC